MTYKASARKTKIGYTPVIRINDDGKFLYTRTIKTNCFTRKMALEKVEHEIARITKLNTL